MIAHHLGMARALLTGAGVLAAILAGPTPGVAQAQSGRGAPRGAANTPVDLRDGAAETPPASADRREVAEGNGRGEHPGTPSSDTAPPTARRAPIEKQPIRRDGGHAVGLGASATGGEGDANLPATSGTGGLLWRALSGLAIVCGLMLVGILVLKRMVPGAQRGGHSEAMAVLGRAYVGPKASLCLVKVGRRILVLGTTPAGISRVAEISDSEEVQEVAARCRQSRSGSITNSFRQLLVQGLSGHRKLDALDQGDASETEDDRLAAAMRESGGEKEDRSEGHTDDETSAGEVGLMRQELDLILDKVRSWRKGGAGGDTEDS